MVDFADSESGMIFIATGDSRRTSDEIMRAIAFFARDESEAVALWDGDAIDRVATLRDIWEHATKNGLISDESLFWGDRTLCQIMRDAETD